MTVCLRSLEWGLSLAPRSRHPLASASFSPSIPLFQFFQTLALFSDLQIFTIYNFFLLIFQIYTRNSQILRFPQAKLPNSKNSERARSYLVAVACNLQLAQNSAENEERMNGQNCMQLAAIWPLSAFLVLFRRVARELQVACN